MSFMYLAVEDELSEAVGKRIIETYAGANVVTQVLRGGGFGYLRSRLSNFSKMSQRYPLLLLTDLDRAACAPILKEKWFGSFDHPSSFLFRIAVREIESWLLADAYTLAVYLGINEASIPRDPDSIIDPKQKLVSVAKKAKKNLRLDIVPERGSRSIQGIGYNRALCNFVEEYWDIGSAVGASDSLNRACQSVASISGRVQLGL